MKKYLVTTYATAEWQCIVEADSEEEARKKLENDIDGFYVRTEYGEQPADDSWEVGEIYDIIQEEN